VILVLMEGVLTCGVTILCDDARDMATEVFVL
jgi:hypothetical protein